MMAEGQKRKDDKLIRMLRMHATILISPYAKKGQRLDPRKIWPIEGERIPKASNQESFKKSLDFFRNRNWQKKKVVN